MGESRSDTSRIAMRRIDFGTSDNRVSTGAARRTALSSDPWRGRLMVSAAGVVQNGEVA
jgi:hypothetical protein